MTEDDIKEEILSQFGAPTLKVEIDDTQWPKLFARAKRWFHSKKGLLACGMFPGGQVIDFPADAENIIEVVADNASGCSGIGALLSFGFFNDFVPADIMRAGGYASFPVSISGWVQIQQNIEDMRRVFNSDPTWYVDCGHIYITGGAAQVFIVYKRKAWEISELRDRDEDIFYRYCLNEAKYVLGRIRGKYKSYPAAGGSIDTDAEDLINEWKEDRPLLDEELADMQGPMGIVIG